MSSTPISHAKCLYKQQVLHLDAMNTLAVRYTLMLGYVHVGLRMINVHLAFHQRVEREHYLCYIRTNFLGMLKNNFGPCGGP